eukprot:TRINITY_DN2862_c0_g3_i4.p1 TRINITY_DN2862_c0_g3~~TRINITY_DN2862_c0_g3_i4.p1  ORF type:complete len:483 (+),score=68.32 TRINITY_DN2862_c0_g3_i4:131-1579(+)
MRIDLIVLPLQALSKRAISPLPRIFLRRYRAAPKKPGGPPVYRGEVTSYSEFSGSGVIETEDKKVFVPRTIVGETVYYSIRNEREDYYKGYLEDVAKVSPLRVEPKCGHFEKCVGCELMHIKYDEQLKIKLRVVLQFFEEHGITISKKQILEPLRGSLWDYAKHAMFDVEYDKIQEKFAVGYRPSKHALQTEIERCEVLDPRLAELPHKLSKLVTKFLPEMNVTNIDVSALNNVSIIFIHENPLTEIEKKYLAVFGREGNFWVYTYMKKSPLVPIWPNNGEFLFYTLPSYNIQIKLKPNHSFPRNLEVHEKLIGLVENLLDIQPTDTVLNMYCGLGNFALPLSRKAKRIAGVDTNRELIDWAKQNAIENRITNVQFLHREIARGSKLLNVHGYLVLSKTDEWTIDKILIDAPFGGIPQDMSRSLLMLSGAKKILYISPHPLALARDLTLLTRNGTLKISKVGVADIAPNSANLKAFVLLERT